MDAKNIAKRIALRAFPERVLHFIKKVHYARVVRKLSENEEPDLKVVRHLVRMGNQVADLGANIGIYTKHLSELVGVAGRVYSVEPTSLTFDILRSNVRKLGLKNVELKNCAISDVDGYVTMEVPQYESGGENFYTAHVIRHQGPGFLRRSVVPSTTIDSLFSGMPSPLHFIKCDVEGHELSCVRGAVCTIHRSKPAWLIEISGNPDDEKSGSHQVFHLLLASGYQAYYFDGAKLRVRKTRDSSINYFFLCPEHLRVLEEREFPVER
jgi:FkbM family methyltransferase